MNISKKSSLIDFTMSRANHLNISAFPTAASSKKRPRPASAAAASSIEAKMEIIDNLHPTDYVKAAFRANGFCNFDQIVADCAGRVTAPTQAMIDAYNTEVLDAVRNNDLEKAKKLYKEGVFPHGCNACNRFGESILHIACRRGHLGMVKFLVEEVGLSITTIRDDYERTPLHDAFWTSNASYEVVDFLLSQPNVTELLLCRDKRGFTPMDYSRGEDRSKWLGFLWKRRAQLKPLCDADEIYSPSKRQRIIA